jgi:hypothetical protein
VYTKCIPSVSSVSDIFSRIRCRYEIDDVRSYFKHVLIVFLLVRPSFLSGHPHSIHFPWSSCQEKSKLIFTCIHSYVVYQLYQFIYSFICLFILFLLESHIHCISLCISLSQMITEAEYIVLDENITISGDGTRKKAHSCLVNYQESNFEFVSAFSHSIDCVLYSKQ